MINNYKSSTLSIITNPQYYHQLQILNMIINYKSSILSILSIITNRVTLFDYLLYPECYVKTLNRKYKKLYFDRLATSSSFFYMSYTLATSSYHNLHTSLLYIVCNLIKTKMIINKTHYITGKSLVIRLKVVISDQW